MWNQADYLPIISPYSTCPSIPGLPRLDMFSRERAPFSAHSILFAWRVHIVTFLHDLYSNHTNHFKVVSTALVVLRPWALLSLGLGLKNN